jgi:hypothetical protein
VNPAKRNSVVAGALAVLIVSFSQDRRAVQAAPLVTDWCSSVCGEETSCTEPCLIVQGQLPAIEITCGEYDGGPANDQCDGDDCATECQWWSGPDDVCWWQDEETTCQDYGGSGDCGDDICVSWQGESCDTCPEDCGGDCPIIVCDNAICEYGETWRNCPEDCVAPGEDDCGDEVCGPTENEETCEEDCLFPGEYCGSAPYLYCDTGWVCVQDQCIFNDPNKYQCCGGAAYQCAYNTNQCPFGYYCSDTEQFFDEPVCVKMWGA